MPPLHGSCSAADCVATSERNEAASGVMWSVLEEDVMLGFGAEVRHGVVGGSELARRRASDAAVAREAQKTVFDARLARTTELHQMDSNQ